MPGTHCCPCNYRKAAPHITEASIASQQQGYPGAPPPYQGQYYQGYPSYPPYPYPQQKSSGGGLPFYVWIGVGALVMWGYSKISGLVRGGPQAAQAKMMSWVRHSSISTVAGMNPALQRKSREHDSGLR